MELKQAKKILELLADGINPATGEPLEEYDSCNQVDVVRALHIVLRHYNAPNENTKKAPAENAGKPWTSEDDEILCRMFDTGCSTQDMCNHFQRSKGGIAARLVRIGKINSRDELQCR